MVEVIPLSERSCRFIKSLIQNAALDGSCYELAIALHRATHYPLMGLWSDMFISDKGTTGSWRHVGVLAPDGCIWDARGPVSAKDFSSYFNLPLVNLKEITEQDLLAVYPIQEPTIALFARLAQAAWPELPWPNSSLQNRYLAFLTDLEALSQHHKIWIRASVPGQPPFLAEGDEPNLHYTMSLTEDVGAVFFDRTF